MRNKIIAVNAVIVLIVGILAFAVVKWQLDIATSSPEQLKRSAQRDSMSAASKLQLDALRAERWLATRAADKSTQQLLAKATHDARAAAARQLADQLASDAATALGTKPSIVAVVDSTGKMIARDHTDSPQVDVPYPAFKEALAKSSPGSDVWTDKSRSDQYITSYVPIRDADGRVSMLVLGTSLNDALGRVADSASGRGLFLVSANGELVANTQTASDDAKEAVKSAGAEVKNALGTGTVVSGVSKNIAIATAPLEGFGDGKRTAVVAAAPPALLEGTNNIAFSILLAMGLGVVLVIIGGWMLGNYISRPIAALEEGLLMILNGQTDKRFELDHAELGGLAFRIDQLLNQLMGVEEDNTDDEGRVSKAPTAANFGEALAVDRSQGGGAGDVDAGRLATEPAEQYYARLYREYISAKRALGEDVDHITDAAFKSRIQGMEQDATAKHGRPVRYHVLSNGKEVVLLAVPLD